MLLSALMLAGCAPGKPTGEVAATASEHECPAPGLAMVRNKHLGVRYEGQADDGICLQTVGELRQEAWLGLWPANWPEGASATRAYRNVLAAGPGATGTFGSTVDVPGNGFVTSILWRFTLGNAGIGSRTIAGQIRPVVRLSWDEQSFGRVYLAHAEIEKDVETGAILAETFRVVRGSSSTASDYWNRYGGGLDAIPDFVVTKFE